MRFLNVDDIYNVIDTNNDIKSLSDNDILLNINKLKNVGCNDNEIRNIIITNPFYLSRFDSDIDRLINKLYSIGLKSLNYVFDSYPFILNKDSYEIDDFIINKLEEGLSMEDVCDLLDSSPYVIDEV